MMRKISVLLILLFTLSFTNHPLTWVAIGDSITYLNDHADETGNRVTKGYMTQVVKTLPNIKYVNQGHNGWTSGGIADAIEKLGIPTGDVYSVFLGTNDWWHGDSIGVWNDYTAATGKGTVYGAFRIIIKKIRQLNSHAKIILITPMQRGDFVYIHGAKNNAWGSYKEKNGKSLEQFVNAIIDIGAREKFAVVDLYHDKQFAIPALVKFKRLHDPATGEYRNYGYPGYINIPFNPDTDAYPYPSEASGMTYDGLHPSDKGNSVIARRLIKILKKY